MIERLGRRRAAGQELVQDGQQEGGRLAGAGLGGGDEVAAGEDGRDGLGLDGRGLGVAHLADGLDQDGVQAEGFERHSGTPRATSGAAAKEGLYPEGRAGPGDGDSPFFS